MGKPGQSATDLGRPFQATAQEINRLLKDQGFTYGNPGAYGLTQKGEAFGIQVHHGRGTGGYASMNPSWEPTYWDNRIATVLDVNPENLATVRATISAERLAKSAARKVAQAEAEAAFLASLPSDAVESGNMTIDPRKVLICVGGALLLLGVGYGIYKVSPVVKRKWDERAAPGLSNIKDRITGRTTKPDADADSAGPSN